MKHNEALFLIDHLNPFNVLRAKNIYMYGSRVYGTQSDQSDYDFIMVSDMEEPFVQFHSRDLNCTAFSISEFEKRLAEYEITILECVFLPENMILKNSVPYPNHITNVDLYALRRSVSAKASNSYVKAKKKFTVEADRDIYVGKKSLFHALRIPMFGEQIGRHGKIIDYGAANHFWPEIRDCAITDWKYYHKKYKPIFNGIMSNFRKVAPKG